MPSLLRRLLARDNETTTGFTVSDYGRMFGLGSRVNIGGRAHQAVTLGGYGPGSAAYDGNSIVFACEAKRAAVFSEARFMWQRMRQGRPGELFADTTLRRLDEPWPGAHLRDLLVACDMDVLSAGNSYWTTDEAGFYVWLDPARVKILTTATLDPVSGARIGEQLAGYGYRDDAGKVMVLAPSQVAHYKPIPSPNRFLGASWLSPCLPDVDADELLTQHKRVSLRSGTNLGYVVSIDPTVTKDDFDAFVQDFQENHEGPANSGKTVFLGGGADIKTVGQSFEQLSLKATQGAGETRIAACAGTPPTLVGLSEGLQGSSLNQGNYQMAKRSFADTTIRPMWGAWAAAFQTLVPMPGSDVRLWYDDRDIPFLRDDVLDQAEIMSKAAVAIRSFTDAGFKPDAAVAAVAATDLGVLVGAHSGLFSVQLQPPLATDPAARDTGGDITEGQAP